MFINVYWATASDIIGMNVQILNARLIIHT